MRFETKQVSIRKLDKAERNGGKSWVVICPKPDVVRWLPSFEEMFYAMHVTAHVIAICEEEKYPSERGLLGADMVADYLEAVARSIRGTRGRLSPAEIDVRWFSIKDRMDLP